jgi:hypothetical protein
MQVHRDQVFGRQISRMDLQKTGDGSVTSLHWSSRAEGLRTGFPTVPAQFTHRGLLRSWWILPDIKKATPSVGRK